MDAATLKEEGNAAFKAKEYKAAIEAYTRSLELNPNQHLCYSNRSASHMKMDGFEQALADAEKCVELKPDWAKGYRRLVDALFQLKRSSEATAWLHKGLENCPAGDDQRATLEQALADVPKWIFQNALSGTWNGTVNEVLGGYDQEMEFLDTDRVRVHVLGRAITGRYWVDVSVEPHHLNIQVPCGEVPPGMPPPPPVPYIARIDEVGLHLCCPYLKMDRPTEFVGPGYVLMKKGAMVEADNSEVAKLSKKEQYKRCVQELIKVVPNRKIEEPSAIDSEDAAGEKLMIQVRFESSMYQVVKLFGEEMVKDVLNATKGEIPADLVDVEELGQLSIQLKNSGLTEDGPSPSLPSGNVTGKSTGSSSGSATERATTSTSKPTGSPPASAPTQKDDASGSDRPASDDKSDSLSCSPAVGGILVSAAALAALAFMLSRKQRA